jgi:hypothetical protein
MRLPGSFRFQALRRGLRQVPRRSPASRFESLFRCANATPAFERPGRDPGTENYRTITPRGRSSKRLRSKVPGRDPGRKRQGPRVPGNPGLPEVSQGLQDRPGGTIGGEWRLERLLAALRVSPGFSRTLFGLPRLKPQQGPRSQPLA